MKLILLQSKSPNVVAGCLRGVITISFVLGFNAIVYAQSMAFKDDLLNVKALSDSLTHTKPIEKLYLQFDKPYYAIGDTIWFKAYLFNAAYFTASDKSGIMYLDIANDSSKIVKQYSVPVEAGLGWGNVSLDEKEFNAGTYTIRAYTKWMLNFGDGNFFSKTFYVAGSGENNWLVNKQVKEFTEDNNRKAEVKLRLSDINNIPAANKALSLQVMAGKKHLYKQAVQTDQNGLIDVNFKLPEKPANLAIIAESVPAGKKAVIPFALNDAGKTDVQFLPEGGNLVAGLPARIGFKAIGEDGKGVDISGIITDHNQKKVAEFKSLHSGMGSFDIDVEAAGSYTAKVTLPGGTIKEYPLPAIKNTGLVLKVKNPVESDSVTVSVAATNDVVQAGDSYFLIGKARGLVCYAAIFNFHESNFVKKKIAKNLFPTGITHFTIMNTKYQPLNERLVFIDQHNNLNIEFKTDKPVYGSRDAIALKIKVTDRNGKPLQGNFSLAVTDDVQVKTDTANNENINTRMLLTADLKGYIEYPGYYLSSKTTEAWQALDNLLLTQGWIGYDWGQVFNPPVISFQPEYELKVTGRVWNVFNKPVKRTDVLLFSKTPAILMDTSTNNEGKFTFSHFPQVDTPIFVLKAVNRNGKSFNVGISVDEIKPPEFTKPNEPLTEPWYVNSDSTFLNYAKSNAFVIQQDYFPAGGHRLKEVKITAKKIIKDSQNLNGPGNADLVLDEKFLEKAGKKNWLQLLQENIKDMRVAYKNVKTFNTVYSGNLPAAIVVNKSVPWYWIHDKFVRFIIDGVELNNDLLKILAGVGQESANIDYYINSLNYFLESHNAEDIKGIELNYSSKYNDRYGLRFDAFDDAFIEITTRSGQGPTFTIRPARTFINL